MPLTTQTRTFASWTTTKGRLRFSLWNSTSPKRVARGQIPRRGGDPGPEGMACEERSRRPCLRIFKLGAMSKKTGKKREAPISYRPPAALREEFHSRVEKSGLSASAFLTKSVFSNDAPRQSRRPATEEKLLAQLLAQAAQIREELKRVSGPDSQSARPSRRRPPNSRKSGRRSSRQWGGSHDPLCLPARHLAKTLPFTS